MPSPLRSKGRLPTAQTHAVNRSKAFLFSKECATPNNHLPFHIDFQRTRQEIVCPAQKFPDRETFCFGLPACHILCSSQKSLTAAPVSFYPHPVFQNEVPPALTRAFSAWRFFAISHSTTQKTPCFTKQSSPQNIPFFMPVNRQKSTRCPRMCSPTKPPAAFRFFAGTRLRSLPCHAKILHCATWALSRLFRSPQPVALAGNPLSLGSLFGEPHWIARNEILQSIFG